MIKPEVLKQLDHITGRYFLIDAEGGLANRNAYGKFADFVFKQRGTALIHAGRRKVKVFDNQTKEFINA